MPVSRTISRMPLPCRCNTRISNAPSAPTIRFPSPFRREPTYPLGQISVGDRVRITLAITPLTGAAVARTFSTRTVGKLDLAESMSVLTAKVAAVQGGDLREAEAILTAQALALNAIFTEMAVYAGRNMKHSLDVVERC